MNEELRNQVKRAEAHVWAIKAALNAAHEEVAALTLPPPHHNIELDLDKASKDVEKLRADLEDAAEDLEQ